MSHKDAAGGHSPPVPGLVLSHLGQGLLIEAEDGEVWLCHTRRQLGAVAAGDRVEWCAVAPGQGRVERVLPRKSALTRPAHGGRVRVVAANLDQLVIIVAPEPEPDWLLVDQYLAASEHRGLGVMIVVNKIDQGKTLAFEATLAGYEAIGYPNVKVSALSGDGLEGLRQALEGKSSLLSGQSGVGKSSLTNALLPGKNVRTRELSEKAQLGRHTTTAAMLYHLPSGGDLIDSPGVAVFGLAEMDLHDLAWGFREFRPHLADCQFNDCRHLGDLGCAIQREIDRGTILPERYQRFIKLLGKMHLG